MRCKLFNHHSIITLGQYVDKNVVCCRIVSGLKCIGKTREESLRQLALQVLCLVWICANSINGIQAALVIDDFEDQTNTSGANTRLHYFSFGEQLSDRGVSNQLGATSGSFSAFYSINFDESGLE